MTWYEDYRGVTPEVGDYVAYNKSGNIAIGTVIKISNNGVLTIQEDVDAMPRIHRTASLINKPNTSKVRKSSSVLVLKRKDLGTWL